MDKNPLLQNQQNKKFNPDIMMKYDQMKKNRNNVVVTRTSQPIHKVIAEPSPIDPKKLANTRMQQDQTFSQIFSKENFIKNKLIYENRNKEISDLAKTLNIKNLQTNR